MKSLRRSGLFVVVAVAIAASAGAVAAAPATTTSQPFSQVFYNPCTGEPFHAEGEIHLRAQQSLSPDGRLHVTVGSSLQNVKGTGLTSGARYVAQQVLAEHTNADGDFAPFNTNSNFLEHYIRQGETGSLPEEDDDFFFWIRLHLTVNAGGVTTVDRIEMESECR